MSFSRNLFVSLLVLGLGGLSDTGQAANITPATSVTSPTGLSACTTYLNDSFYGDVTVTSYSSDSTYTCSGVVDKGGTTYKLRFMKADEEDPSSLALGDSFSEDDAVETKNKAAVLENACEVLKKAKDNAKSIRLNGPLYSCPLTSTRLIVSKYVGIGDSVSSGAHALEGLAENTVIAKANNTVQSYALYTNQSGQCYTDLKTSAGKYFEGHMDYGLWLHDEETFNDNDASRIVSWAQSYCSSLLDAHLNASKVDVLGVIYQAEGTFFAEVGLNAVKASDATTSTTTLSTTKTLGQ